MPSACGDPGRLKDTMLGDPSVPTDIRGNSFSVRVLFEEPEVDVFGGRCLSVMLVDAGVDGWRGVILRLANFFCSSGATPDPTILIFRVIGWKGRAKEGSIGVIVFDLRAHGVLRLDGRKAGDFGDFGDFKEGRGNRRVLYR